MKPRCFNCNKKLSLMKFECKCRNTFCQSCLLPEKHNCTFDFKADGKAKLENSLEKVVNTKIEVI